MTGKSSDSLSWATENKTLENVINRCSACHSSSSVLQHLYPSLHMIKALVLLEMCQAIKPVSASLAVSVTFACEKQEMTAEHNILQKDDDWACLMVFFGTAQRLLWAFRIAACRVQCRMQVIKFALLILKSCRIIWPGTRMAFPESELWEVMITLLILIFLWCTKRGSKVICTAPVPCHMLIWLLCKNKKLVIYTSTSGLSWVCYLLLRCWHGLTVDELWWHTLYSRMWHRPEKYLFRCCCFLIILIAS